MQHCFREGGIVAGGEVAGGGARSTSTDFHSTLEPRIWLYAVVIMPDHVHLLFSPRRGGDGWPFPVVDILQGMKSATAHRINKFLGHAGPVWQEESFDHVLRSDESLKEKCEYICQNPVRKGLVARPEDYRWLWVDPNLCGAAGPAARS